MYPELSLVNLQLSLPLTSKQLIFSLISTHFICSFIHSFIQYIPVPTLPWGLLDAEMFTRHGLRVLVLSEFPDLVVMFLSAKRIVLTPLCLLNLLASFQTQHKPHLLLTRPSPHFLWSTLSFYTHHFLINYSAISNILPDGLTPVML